MADKEKQVAMHKDFFDRTQSAIDQGFFLEAVFAEYAAMESRLEVLCGVLQAPCSKDAADQDRKDIKISHRIKCLSTIYKADERLSRSKLDHKFWKDIEKWCNQRNRLIHGLYKNEIDYESRIIQSREFAEEGFVLCRKLYNEAKRLRRNIKDHAVENADLCINCKKASCKLSTLNKEN